MTRTPHTLMALGVSIFLTIGCQTNPQTTGHYIDDTAITTSVKTHLATDGPLKTMTQISVKTVENTVYLTGVAPTLQAKNRAEEIARQVEGVQTVVNNIIVQP
jgi:hyperosmotically inducible periplasmic protein